MGVILKKAQSEERSSLFLPVLELDASEVIDLKNLRSDLANIQRERIGGWPSFEIEVRDAERCVEVLDKIIGALE